MDPTKHEDSNSDSREETNQSDQPSANDEIGATGRSYECVFCKRGFTKAQALGGHMNIHRKYRTKPRRSSSFSSNISSKSEESHDGFRAHPPIQSYHKVHVNYQRFYPGSSTWGFRPSHADNLWHLMNRLGEDWRRSSLNLENDFDSSDIDGENKRKREEEKEEEEDDYDDDVLDLELRLGHNHGY